MVVILRVCLIFKVTVFAQADVESDAVEEKCVSYVRRFWVLEGQFSDFSASIVPDKF